MYSYSVNGHDRTFGRLGGPVAGLAGGMGSNGYAFDRASVGGPGFTGLGASAYHAAGAVAAGAHPFDGLYYAAGAQREIGLGRYGEMTMAEKYAAQEAGVKACREVGGTFEYATLTCTPPAPAAPKEDWGAVAGAGIKATADIIRARLDRQAALQRQHDADRAAADAQARMLARIRGGAPGLAAGAPAGGGMPGWLVPVALGAVGLGVALVFLRRRRR